MISKSSQASFVKIKVLNLFKFKYGVLQNSYLGQQYTNLNVSATFEILSQPFSDTFRNSCTSRQQSFRHSSTLKSGMPVKNSSMTHRFLVVNMPKEVYCFYERLSKFNAKFSVGSLLKLFGHDKISDIVKQAITNILFEELSI